LLECVLHAIQSGLYTEYQAVFKLWRDLDTSQLCKTTGFFSSNCRLVHTFSIRRV